MDVVNKGLGGGEGGGAVGGEQWLPAGIDNPVDDPLGMGLAEGGDGGQGVEDITHGAEADHKEAEVGVGLQTPIFSQGRVESPRLSRTAEGRVRALRAAQC